MDTSLNQFGWRSANPSPTNSINVSQTGNISSSFKKPPSDIILSERSNFTLEGYGAPLPTMVRSLLHQVSDRNQTISSRVDPNGWSWVVTGRKLYVWKYIFGNESKRNNVILCRELILPTSELDHQAQLVCILAAGDSGSNAPSCIAVSPEGQIIYWPNISNDSGTVTISADIPGQECESLYSLWPNGCILTTTTSTLLLIKTHCAGGKKYSVTCSPVILSKGWLGGIGRKMSNMLFNPIPMSASGENKRARVAVPISKDDPSQPGRKNPQVYILHGITLQTWGLSGAELVHMNSTNLEPCIRNFFAESVFTANQRIDQMRRIQILCLDVDVQPNSDVAVLVACFDPSESSPVVHYGIVVVKPNEIANESFIPISYTTPYLANDDDNDNRSNDLLTWRLLVTSTYYCMLNAEMMVFTSGDIDDGDVLAAGSSGGPFLGFGKVTDNTISVFNPKYGILSVRVNAGNTLLDNRLVETIKVPDNLVADVSQYNFSDALQSDDNVNRLKLAFLAFIGKRSSECESILQAIFPDLGAEWTTHSSIDLIVLNLCEKLVNDSPPTDARAGGYGSAEPDLLGYRSKQNIFRCLNSKKEALELYFGFLSNVNILQQLTRVVVNEDVQSTCSILYNNYEKVGFALAIFQLLGEAQYYKHIDAAIRMVVQYRSNRDPCVRSSHLNVNEQFFKDVSLIHYFIKSLLAYEDGVLNAALPSDMPMIVSKMNEILLKAFSEIQGQLQDRINIVRTNLLESSDHPSLAYETRHWLMEPDTLNSLLKQTRIIVTNGIKVTDDAGIRIKLLKELEDFTEIILGGLERNLRTIMATSERNERRKRFEEVRSELFKNFVSLKDADRAIMLAEKYRDYSLLIGICVDKQDYEKLEYYFRKFETDNFAELTFEWFLQQKRPEDLYTKFLHSAAIDKLKNFLRNYPEMLWHLEARLGETQKSANTLLKLANEDGISARKRLLLLQLSKIGMLAAGVPAVEVDSMREYDACNQGAVDVDLLSNMSINESTGDTA